MRNAIGSSIESERRCASSVVDGRARAILTEILEAEMDCDLTVRNAKANIDAGITSRPEGLRQKILDMKKLTGSSMGSKRSYAASAKNGKARGNFTKTADQKMGCSQCAQNVGVNINASVAGELEMQFDVLL